MSESQGRESRDFSRYDSMETAELEEILRLDADASEGAEPDVELILHVLEVLDKRNRIKEVVGDRTQEAYESFKQDYFPEDAHIEEEPKPARRPLRLVRRLATAAAAVLVFVMLGTVTANAFGFNIWKVVAVWAQETFHFERAGQAEVYDPEPDVDLPYASLEEAIYALEKVSGIAPTWIPEGYELTDITIDETPLQKIYIGFYENEDKNFKVTIKSCLEDTLKQIEQSDGYAETYIASETVYYIFANYDQIQAAWTKDLYECHISGDVTVEQIENMIDSIEKG